MSNILDDLLSPISFTFKCLHCGESFNIHFSNMQGRPYFECPNCKQVFSAEAMSFLQGAISSLDVALNILKRDNIIKNGYLDPLIGSEENKGFRLTINWPNSKLLPDDSEGNSNF